MKMEKDYYQVLQVTPQATLDEINSAYQRRVRELHPDASESENERLLEIQEAYAVLSDVIRRASYDRTSEPAARSTRIGGRRGPSPLPVEAAGGFEDLSLFGSFETIHPSFDELFERWWSNFGGLTRPKAEQLSSLTVDFPLTDEQAAAGGEARLLVPARIECPACRGHGHLGHYECWRCEGHGALTGEYPVAVRYPAGIHLDYVVRLPLDELGIHNFYLTVRFRTEGRE